MASADLVILNADVRTQDLALPRATSVAVKGGRVLALGTDADLRPLRGPTTRVIDAGGRLVLPGFQDTHIHPQDSGIDSVRGCELAGAQTLAELQHRLRAQAQATSALWVRGLGWNSAIFNASNLDRHVLDAAVPDRPAFIFAADGHNAVLNTRGCEAIGMRADTPHPPNGEIVHEAGGTPSGMLYEDACYWAMDLMPPPSAEDSARGVKFAADLANRHGITGLLDAMVAEKHMQVYTDLDRAGELSVRMAATTKVFPHEGVDEALERLCHIRTRYRSEKVFMHSAKFFLDGVMENGTAAMLEDYESGGNAPIMFELDHLARLLDSFDAHRFQLHLHTIGDRAVRVALDGIEAARRTNGPWPALHQLAHLQIIDPADIPRFRELGALANFQPLWAAPEPGVIDVALPMVGKTRGRWMYPVKSVIDAGGPYAISSDWAVSTLNPFEIMQVAITRQNPEDGPSGECFVPEERLDVDRVVKGYTTNAAAAAWRSEDTGSLSPGKFADLIVLDRDIYRVPAHELGATQVLLTLLGGEEVHRADDFEG